jgi:hypothetical protein
MLTDLNAYLQANPVMPSIDDPSCPTESLNPRWNQEQYSNFRSWIKLYTTWAKDAHTETDIHESYSKWRKLFGDKFGTYSTTALKVSESHKASLEYRTPRSTICGCPKSRLQSEAPGAHGAT